MTVQESRTHALDMNSIINNKQKHENKPETCIKVDNLSLFYGEKQALHGINMEMPKKKSHCLYWSQRLRQIDIVALY